MKHSRKFALVAAALVLLPAFASAQRRVVVNPPGPGRVVVGPRGGVTTVVNPPGPGNRTVVRVGPRGNTVVNPPGPGRVVIRR